MGQSGIFMAGHISRTKITNKHTHTHTQESKPTKKRTVFSKKTMCIQTYSYNPGIRKIRSEIDTCSTLNYVSTFLHKFMKETGLNIADDKCIPFVKGKRANHKRTLIKKN